MSESAKQPQQNPAWQRWVDWMTAHRRETGIGFVVVAAVFAGLPLWLGLKYGEDYLLATIVACFLPIIALLGAVWASSADPSGGKLSPAESMRMLLLVTGGLIGLWLVIFAAVLGTWYWWTPYFAKGLEVWREEWWRLALCLGSLIGGLALMFASLNLGQVDVRSSPVMRRVLYGYTAVLNGLLVLVTLCLLNILAYLPAAPFKWFNQPTDWTAAKFYTLSPSSQNILSHLDKPVKVYVLEVGGGDNRFINNEVQTLLDNCRAYTDKIQVEYLSADRNKDRVRELRERYKDKNVNLDRYGILIVYGTEPNEKPAFINTVGELFQSGPDGLKFDGEDAFIKRIRMLSEGQPAKVYLTQGQGELDANSFTEDQWPPGMGFLKNRLGDYNMDVQEITFTKDESQAPRRNPVRLVTEIPSDADLVIIVNPVKFPQEGVDALQKYMNRSPNDPKRNGKLIILAGMEYDRRYQLRPTGLDDFLDKFNVKLGDKPILSFPSANTPVPMSVLVVADPNSRNPVVRELRPEGDDPTLFAFDLARTVRPKPPEGAPNKPIVVEPYLDATGHLGSENWGIFEDDQNVPLPNWGVLVQLLNQPRNAQAKKQLVKEDLPVAVTVTERDGTPRMAVFGSSLWVSNDNLRPGVPNSNFTLIRSTVNWLRENPDIGKTADPKVQKPFVLEHTEATSRLYWTPFALIAVGTVALGGGIWLVRRR